MICARRNPVPVFSALRSNSARIVSISEFRDCDVRALSRRASRCSNMMFRSRQIRENTDIVTFQLLRNCEHLQSRSSL